MASLLKSTINTRVLPAGDGRFIRSDCPAEITDEEIRWLADQNITTAVDLRELDECRLRPCRLENEPGFTYYHLPVSSGSVLPKSPEGVLESYRSMLDAQMDRIIETIMNADSRVIYFCHAGKDRTGSVSAVLLKKLGCDDETIIRDYMETKDNVMGMLEAYTAEHPEQDISFLIPKEENIRLVLEAYEAADGKFADWIGPDRREMTGAD